MRRALVVVVNPQKTRRRPLWPGAKGRMKKKETEEAFLESGLKGRDGGLDWALTQST